MKESFRANFMVIGAQKCGTTSLAKQLSEHPEICFSDEKEPGFFNSTADWMLRLEEYHSLYSPSPGQLCGEASTMYTFLPEFKETHMRLHEYNPNLKLIYMMRQPVERIISHYAHRVNHGHALALPEKAVLDDPSFIQRSRYGFQIQPYIQLFGRNKIHFILFEDYTSDPIEILMNVASFLGVSPEPFKEVDLSAKNQSEGRKYLGKEGREIRTSSFAKAAAPLVPESIRKAVKKYFVREMTKKPAFPAELRKTLWDALENDVQLVEQLMGRRLNEWRKGDSS